MPSNFDVTVDSNVGATSKRTHPTSANVEYDRLQTKLARLEQLKQDLLSAGSHARSRLSFIQENDEDIQLYTGFHNYDALMSFYDFLEPGSNGANLLPRPRSVGKNNSITPTAAASESGRLSRLSLQNEMLLTLMKLRLGLRHQDLAYRFGLTCGEVSEVFETWLHRMDERLTTIDVWLESTQNLVTWSARSIPTDVEKKNCPQTTKSILFHNLDLKTVSQSSSDWMFSDLNCIVQPKRAIIGFSPSGKVTSVSPVSSRSDKNVKGTYGSSKDVVSFENDDTFISTEADRSLSEQSPQASNSSEETVTLQEKQLSVGIVDRLMAFRILERTIPCEEVDTIVNVCCRLSNCQNSL